MAKNAALSDDLKSAFRNANGAASQTRFITVSIENEIMTVKRTVNKSGTWSRDFDMVKDEFEDQQPLFVIYWKDQASERAVFTGRESVGSRPARSKVLLMLYSPDDAPVREKMTYASFWNSLKEFCGAGADEYQGSTKEEFTYANFNKLRSADDSVLSEAEKVLRETAIADPVSFEEAKAASGFNIIAMSKGIKEMPKIVQDSLAKAHQAKSGNTQGGAKRFKVADASASSSAPVNSSSSNASWVTHDSSVASGEALVKPSQMKKWPPEKPAE
jgi:hypothetical protein